MKFRKLAKFKDILEVLISPRLLTTFQQLIMGPCKMQPWRIPWLKFYRMTVSFRDILAKGTWRMRRIWLRLSSILDLRTLQKSLLARFIKLHPEIQSLLDRDAESSSSS